MVELLGKQEAVAGLIDGEVIDDSDRVAVCIKGIVNGFPARLETFMVGFPWSVSYALETNIVENPDEDRSHYNKDQAKINFVPRIGKGMWSILSRLFLFETKGQKVHDKQLEKTMIITYDNQEPALRFIKYPGVSEILMTLHDDCHLKEMVVKTDEGIYFNQGVNFKDMDMDLCQATFKYMGELSQVLAEAF